MQREFADERGSTWQVWEVQPSNNGANVSSAYRDGWLAFHAGDASLPEGGERLRLAPVPAEWRTASEATLRSWLAQAVPAPPRYIDDTGRIPRIGPA